MPPKVRELVAELEEAGFVDRGGNCSWVDVTVTTNKKCSRNSV